MRQMKGKKKTRAADIKRRLIDDEREPSPFASIKLVEKKEEEKKPKVKPAPSKPKKPSEIVQGYDPSSSFADILYSFEHTGNPYSMPAPKRGEMKKPEVDFGAILDQWEGRGKKKPEHKAVETKKSTYNPTRSFGDILDSFEGRKPSVKKESISPDKAEEEIPKDTLFREKEEDDVVSSSVSWTIFGGRNEEFRRPEPEKKEEKAEETPVKEEKRKPLYKPSKSFADILSEYEGERKTVETSVPSVKEDPVVRDMPEEKPLSENLFRTPSDGEKRAEGVAWSVFGGNERKPERKTEEAESKPEPVSEKVPVRHYKAEKPFSTILSEYETKDREKTFDEYLKEKGDGERKPAVITISKLRTMPPQATLDLHGDTVKEAEDEVRRFLSECVENRLRKISIITGKGLHSEDGVGVLRQTALRILDESGIVSEISSAPSSAGGSGALWIILKA